MPVFRIMNIEYKEFQLILHVIAADINLIITMPYLQLETKIMHCKNRSKQIFDTIVLS